MQNWMQALAAHYERTRATFVEDDLLILFDIDGTILDSRYMLLYLLQAYDRNHNTGFFSGCRITDMNFDVAQLETGLQTLGVPADHFAAVRAWYNRQRWSMAAVLEAHRPFPGVMDVIRWFQLQPHTHVGLNTARPEHLREETLCSLNKLGHEYRVQFGGDLLFMREAADSDDVIAAKLAGIEHFRACGYRPFAMVDNQPQILEAVAAHDPGEEILLLHAGTLFQQRPEQMPANAVQGNVYDLTELIPKKALPRHIQFVWDGVSSEAALTQFLESNIRWADLSVLTNRYMNNQAARDGVSGQQAQLLQTCLQQLRQADRGIKVNLGADLGCNHSLLRLLQTAGMDSDDLWFHVDMESLGETQFRQLAETHPGAIIETPVDFLAPLISNGGQLAENILDRLFDWGVNRFALSWSTPGVRRLVERLDDWGFTATIYDVRELQDFLQAVLLMPQAICSDFSYAKWQEPHVGKRAVHDIDGALLRHA